MRLLLDTELEHALTAGYNIVVYATSTLRDREEEVRCSERDDGSVSGVVVGERWWS